MRNFLKYKDLSKVYLLLILIISFISLSKTAALADVLPVELTVRINSSTTSKTQIQVSTGWVGTSWMSQEGIGKSIYRIGIKSDGTVISLDGQLDFTPWPDVTDQALRMYIRYPNASSNGADALLYTKDGISVVYGNMGFVDFGNGQLTRGLTEGNGFSIANSSGNWQTWSPLPQYFLIHVPTITPSTRIQVSAYFAAKKWVSQPLLARGDYIIRVDPDGFVRSIDSKLAFTKSAEASDSALTIYTLNPLNENGADYTRYTWSKSSNAIGAISLNSSGYVNFNSGAVSSSSTGNTASTTLTKEVAYPEKFLLRVHLDSVTPWTYLHIPFYWKRVIYRSQIPLPAGDYWIQVMPDPDPNNPNTAPYLLSVDHKLIFERIYCPEAPDPVFAVFIALPKWPEQGFDTVGFIHNFRKPNTYQTMLGENKTGPDLGLGFVYADVRNPKDAITNHPTTPTETLTGGNYVVITDAGLIIGRTMKADGTPLAEARVSIDAVTLITDSNGEFSFSQMVQGPYTLRYSADGYTSQTQIINVLPGEPTYAPWVVMRP